MNATLVLAARIALAVTLAVAGAAKLRDREGARRTAAALGVPATAVPIVAIAVSAAELVIAAGLVIPATAMAAATSAAVLLTVFLVALAVQGIRGVDVPCACFGRIATAPGGGATLLRNAALIGLALLSR